MIPESTVYVDRESINGTPRCSRSSSTARIRSSTSSFVWRCTLLSSAAFLGVFVPLCLCVPSQRQEVQWINRELRQFSFREIGVIHSNRQIGVFGLYPNKPAAGQSCARPWFELPIQPSESARLICFAQNANTFGQNCRYLYTDA